MDGRRFDEWTRFFSAGATRRRAIAALLGAPVAVWRSRRGTAQDQAEPTPDGEEIDAADLGCCRCGADPKTNACQEADNETACIQHCGKGKPFVFDPYSTCEGKVCKPKPEAESGCCTCTNANRKKGCTNVADNKACLTYCDAKNADDISFQATRVCEVSESGARYTCHAKPKSTASFECEPIAGDAVFQRQLVAMVDAAPRLADTKRDGFVRLVSFLTFSFDDIAGLGDAARGELAALGWIGAYHGAIGAVSGAAKRPLFAPRHRNTLLTGPAALAAARQNDPVIDNTAVNTTASFTAHVLSCLPTAGRNLLDLVSVTPGVATEDTKATAIGDESRAYRWEETADNGQTWQHFTTVARVENVVFRLDSAFTGDAKPGRSLNERVAPRVVERIKVGQAFAEPRLAANRLVLPRDTGKINLWGISYDGQYLPSSADTSQSLAINQQKFAAVESAVLAGERWPEEADFYLEIVRHADAGAAEASVANRRGLYNILANSGQPVESRPGADGVDWTFHAAVLTNAEGTIGLLASVSRVDDADRESGLLLTNPALEGDETVFEAFERILGDGYDRFVEFSGRQISCLNVSDSRALCDLFSGNSTTAPDPERPPERPTESPPDSPPNFGGPTGLVDAAAALYYPGDEDDEDDDGILTGIYYPTLASLAESHPLFAGSEQIIDAASLTVGALTETGEFGSLSWKTGYARCKTPDDSQIAYGDLRSYMNSMARETYPAPESFAGRPVWAGAFTALPFGTEIPALDLTVAATVSGSYLLFAARPGQAPDAVFGDLSLVLKYALTEPIRGDGLGVQMPYLTGDRVQTTPSRLFTTLDPLTRPLAGETAEQRTIRDRRGAGQRTVYRQDQGIALGRDDGTLTTSLELRRFVRERDARAWTGTYADDILRDFGVTLQPITEGDNLPGSEDSRFYFFNRSRSDGMLEAALLGTARVDRTVAVLRVATVTQPAAADLIDWFFRDGGRQTAAGSVTVMSRQIALLRAGVDGFDDPGWGFPIPEQLIYR